MRWFIVFGIAGCGKDPTGGDGALVLEAMDGQWSGTALATTQLTYALAATFRFDDTRDPPLTGQGNIDSYLFVVQEASSDTEWADLVLLNTQGRARLELSGVAVNEPKLTGHFEMDLCWATDPGNPSPQCTAEGNFAATRQ